MSVKPADDDSFESILKEAHANAREDRATLKAQIDKISELTGVNVDSAVLLSDTFIKVNDSLIKNNSQFVDLAQLALKAKQEEESNSDDEEDESVDSDDIYNELEQEPN